MLGLDKDNVLEQKKFRKNHFLQDLNKYDFVQKLISIQQVLSELIFS